MGLCAEFPSLSWLEEEQDAALHGIVQLVSETLKDMEASKEPIPTSLCEQPAAVTIRAVPA